MSVLFGLVAALGWGGADFLVRYATRMIGTYRTLFFMQAMGGIGLTIILIASGQLAATAHHAAWQSWLWALLAAGLSTLSSLMLYRAFEIGVLSIVSPIAATYAAFAVILALLSGTRISPLHGAGIVLALVGVGLTATSAPPSQRSADGRRGLPRGVLWALLSAMGFGVTFWLFSIRVTPQLGGIAPVWVVRLVASSTLALVALPTHQSLKWLTRRAWWLIGSVAVLDTTAYVANVFGLAVGSSAIVNVMASLFSVVTVLLAGIFLRERLAWHQWLGIGLVFVSIALVSA
jgi:drug/metabolite transporter (DMT)-like permease